MHQADMIWWGMAMSQTYSGGLVETLVQAIGPERVLIGPDLPELACHDWSAETPGTPPALVTPQDRAGVAAMLRLCHQAGAPGLPVGR